MMLEMIELVSLQNMPVSLGVNYGTVFCLFVIL